VKTRAALTGIFASVGILVVGWQFGSVTTAHSTISAGAVSSGTSGATSSPTTSASAAPSTSAAPSASPSVAPTPATVSGAKDGSYTGSSSGTPFGDVQVKVVVSGGKITDVVALQLTNDGGRSVQISNYAAPILRSEVLKSQSAKVSNVSGATYTTDGYLSSLQSALDQAGF
jgi:uncharacterized protein with FMN-binding domain